MRTALAGRRTRARQSLASRISHLARLARSLLPSGQATCIQGVTNVTNSKSVFQASLWAAISGLLMLAALEPVSIETNPTQVAAVPASQAAA